MLHATSPSTWMRNKVRYITIHDTLSHHTLGEYTHQSTQHTTHLLIKTNSPYLPTSPSLPGWPAYYLLRKKCVVWLTTMRNLFLIYVEHRVLIALRSPVWCTESHWINRVWHGTPRKFHLDLVAMVLYIVTSTWVDQTSNMQARLFCESAEFKAIEHGSFTFLVLSA